MSKSTYKRLDTVDINVEVNMTKNMMKAAFCAVILAAFMCAATCCQEPGQRAFASDLCDLVTPQLIQMYETEIAGKKVVSNMSEAKLMSVANKFSISENKTRAVYILLDLASRTGKEYTFDQLAKMDEWSLFAAAKSCGEIYFAAQTPERQEELKQMLKNALGI